MSRSRGVRSRGILKHQVTRDNGDSLTSRILDRLEEERQKRVDRYKRKVVTLPKLRFLEDDIK